MVTYCIIIAIIQGGDVNTYENMTIVIYLDSCCDKNWCPAVLSSGCTTPVLHLLTFNQPGSEIGTRQLAECR